VNTSLNNNLSRKIKIRYLRDGGWKGG
jgi:hypothetical protein